MPTIAESVAALISRQGCNGEVKADDPQVVAAVEQVTILARAYTRGNGFVDSAPNADITAVIVTAAGRLASNPNQLPVEIVRSDRNTTSYRGAFTGWSTAELFALNRYRVRAM